MVVKDRFSWEKTCNRDRKARHPTLSAGVTYAYEVQRGSLGAVQMANNQGSQGPGSGSSQQSQQGGSGQHSQQSGSGQQQGGRTKDMNEERQGNRGQSGSGSQQSGSGSGSQHSGGTGGSNR